MLLTSHFTEGETSSELWEACSGPSGGHGGIAEQQAPSGGPRPGTTSPWPTQPARVASPAPAGQPRAWALPWLPQETRLLFIKQRETLRSDCRVCVPNPAESKGQEAQEGFLEERAGPGMPQGLLAEPPAHAAEATWGYRSRGPPRAALTSSQEAPMQAAPDGPALPPSWGQSCAPESTPSQAHFEPSPSWQVPQPTARPLCWCVFLGSQGACVSRGDESLQGAPRRVSD